jgi:hypothetical protein
MFDVTVNVFRSDVENKYQDFHVLENVFSLCLEVLLHKHVLATAVPEGEHKVSEESDSMLVYVDRKSNSISVTSQVVGKNDTAHGSLASAHTAHEQYLFNFIGLSRRVPRLLYICWIHFYYS